MIRAEIINGEAAPRRFMESIGKLDSALGRAVTTLAIKLTAKVKTKLSGQVLKVRTGRLRRSVHYEVTNEPGRITAEVGTNVSYARVHEFGGKFTVPQHIRMQSKVFGRALPAPIAVMVRSHERNAPQRAFLTPSLVEMQGEIETALKDAVRVTIEGAR